MPGARTRAQALHRYQEVLQGSLSTLHDAVWRVGQPPRGGGDAYVLLTSADPLPLRRGNDRPPLYLSASQEFTYYREEGGEWRIRTLAYNYGIVLTEDLAGELFLWHWHPATRPGPHLHSVTEHPEEGPVRKLHLPTDRVSFEQVARFLIEELGVEPNREDWNDRLTEAEERYRQHRSWPGPHPEPAPTSAEAAPPGGRRQRGRPDRGPRLSR
jgi:hypothetical protein